MHLRLSLLAACTVGGALVSTPALAWNCRGHMIAAAVAWSHIDDAKKPRLDALLRRNPNSAAWIAQSPHLDPTQAMFIRAACWPDDIKSAADHQDPAPGHPDPFPDNNIGYSDPWRHREWHFKDIAFSPDGTPLVQAPEPTAETEINRFRDTLASSADDEVKSYDLVWLIHLVGDVHQPLHATSRFVATGTKGDGGGNKVCLVGPLFHGQCPNLHSYWDDLFGNGTSPSAANHYANATGPSALPTAPGSAVADATVLDWLTESEQLAESAAYAPPILGDLGPYDLSASTHQATDYHDHALAVARSQVELAGERLAKLINDNLS
jgi:hypothetical protein